MIQDGLKDDRIIRRFLVNRFGIYSDLLSMDNNYIEHRYFTFFIIYFLN